MKCDALILNDRKVCTFGIVESDTIHLGRVYIVSGGVIGFKDPFYLGFKKEAVGSIRI